MLIYHATVDLRAGFEVMNEPKGSRLVRGKNVSLPSGAKLFGHLHATGTPLKCWSCGVEANCFIVNKGQNDRLGPPVLDLFAMLPDGPVLMTRDHIIPKSYGGVNDVANLRMGCGPCNHGRGNELEADDVVFMRAHPELIRHDAKLKLADAAMQVEKKDCRPQDLLTNEQKEMKAEKERARRKRKRDNAKARKAASKLPAFTTMMVLALA